MCWVEEWRFSAETGRDGIALYSGPAPSPTSGDDTRPSVPPYCLPEANAVREPLEDEPWVMGPRGVSERGRWCLGCPLIGLEIGLEVGLEPAKSWVFNERRPAGEGIGDAKGNKWQVLSKESKERTVLLGRQQWP